MFIIVLLTSTVLSFSEIEHTPPKELTEIYSGQKVAVRGFPYATEQGEWILSDEPNLRSCCVGKGPKAAKQIVLQENAKQFTTFQVIEVEGLLAERDNRLVLQDWNTVNPKGAIAWGFYALLMLSVLAGFLGRKAFQWYRR
ncbi:MAG: hypothetical protein WC222_06660 [Parachlamydiales bacterium]|jgi:hypothetical protein